MGIPLKEVKVKTPVRFANAQDTTLSAKDGDLELDPENHVIWAHCQHAASPRDQIGIPLENVSYFTHEGEVVETEQARRRSEAKALAEAQEADAREQAEAAAKKAAQEHEEELAAKVKALLEAAPTLKLEDPAKLLQTVESIMEQEKAQKAQAQVEAKKLETDDTVALVKDPDTGKIVETSRKSSLFKRVMELQNAKKGEE